MYRRNVISLFMYRLTRLRFKQENKNNYKKTLLNILFSFNKPKFFQYNTHFTEIINLL
jgi:hypothetical protein